MQSYRVIEEDGIYFIQQRHWLWLWKWKVNHDWYFYQLDEAVAFAKKQGHQDYVLATLH